jgi:hypothetical protein
MEMEMERVAVFVCGGGAVRLGLVIVRVPTVRVSSEAQLDADA